MRLELAEYPVTRIRLGQRVRYDRGTLEIDAQALEELGLKDERISQISLSVVSPGEDVRVTGIRDIVEPRVKVSGKGQVFPGILGPVEPVGDGRTNRLSGMAVTVTAEYHGTVRAGLGVERSALLDMSGPDRKSVV